MCVGQIPALQEISCAFTYPTIRTGGRSQLSHQHMTQKTSPAPVPEWPPSARCHRLGWTISMKVLHMLGREERMRPFPEALYICNDVEVN